MQNQSPSSTAAPLINGCQQLLAFASEEASALHHNHIGTEHLLLALLRDESIAALIEITREAAQHAVQILFADAVQAAPSVLTTALDARRAVEVALAAAEQHQHPTVATLHLLLGVLADDTNGAARVLAHAGVPIARVRAEVEEVLNRHDATTATQEAQD